MLGSCRCSVFCSAALPVTICRTEDCDEMYRDLLGTDVLGVPKGSAERLEKWPQLKASDEIQLTGRERDTACADIVLSSAGNFFQHVIYSTYLGC